MAKTANIHDREGTEIFEGNTLEQNGKTGTVQSCNGTMKLVVTKTGEELRINRTARVIISQDSYRFRRN